MNYTTVSCAETASYLRRALAERWPGQKFSIRSKTYSGGASIRVRYIDGPPRRDVENISKKFEGATFDGMTDYKGSHDSYLVVNGMRTLVRFHADFIFVDRECSPEFEQAISTIAVETLGRPLEINDHRYWEIHTEISEQLDLSPQAARRPITVGAWYGTRSW